MSKEIITEAIRSQISYINSIENADYSDAQQVADILSEVEILHRDTQTLYTLLMLEGE